MARGHDRERAVKALLQKDGWFVTRAAGSLGDADLVALRRLGTRYCEAWLVEVKSTAGGPYERFGPKDRAELITAARLAGAAAWLCWWPPHKKPIWIPEEEWPDARVQMPLVA